MPGDPLGGVILQPLLEFAERNDFRSSVQKQSLTVTLGFARVRRGQMLESRLEASLGRCWAWSSKPVVRHFVSRVGSTPTSFRQPLLLRHRHPLHLLLKLRIHRLRAA